MKQNIRAVIDDFSAAALATTGPYGINVVPISVVDVRGDEIYLYDFFMGKTAGNIKIDSAVAFTCWKGFCGFQIKADATYEKAGAVYDLAVIDMLKRFPDRTLKAVIRLSPVAVYDVAPGAGGEDCLG